NAQFTLNYYKYTLDYIIQNDDSKGLILPSIIESGTGSSVVGAGISRLMDLYSKKVGITASITDKTLIYQQLLSDIKENKILLIENLKKVIEKLNFEM